MNNETNEPRESIGNGLSILESELSMLVRPSLDTFDTDCDLYHRWYEYGGKPRLKPLDNDELVQRLVYQGYKREDAIERASQLAISNERAVWNALDAAGRIRLYQGGTTVTWRNGKRVRALC